MSKEYSRIKKKIPSLSKVSVVPLSPTCLQPISFYYGMYYILPSISDH